MYTKTGCCELCEKPYKVKKGNARNRNLCDEHYFTYRRAYRLFYTIKNRAKKKDLTFDLTVDWIFEKMLGVCEVTGIEFSQAEGMDYGDRSPTAPSVDKIDPNKGYEQSNCRMCIWWYNVSKQNFTDDEVIELCRRVVDGYIRKER